MTVQIRPVPQRVAGNRIVPFRPVQYTSKVRPVSLKDWKPPVPEPLPPAPLLGLGTLAALGLQALAWAWGQLNSRAPRGVFDPFSGGEQPTTGTVPPPGNTVAAPLRIRYANRSYTTINEPDCDNISVTNETISGDFYRQNVVGVSGPTGSGRGCGYSGLYYIIKFADGTEANEGFGWGTANSGVTWSAGYQFDWIHPTAVPFVNPTTDAIPDSYVAPKVELETAPTIAALAPLPLPLPSTVPQVVPSTEPQTLPAPSPLVPVTPGPVAPPIVRPATPMRPQQPKVPAATGTSNGQLNAPARLPVPVTSPTSIIPWPGAAPIPGTGPAPAPTIRGIAQEVGRIERKLEVMMTPNAPGNLVDQLGNLAELIGPILSAILAAGSGTTYTLDSPCELDEDTGEKLPPVEVEAPGALTQLGAILNRIDAVAELLQVHKNLKQPNCKPQTPKGEFVTVNFEQID